MNKKHFFYTLLISVTSLLFVSCQQEKPYQVIFLTESEGEGMGSKFIVNFKGKTYTSLPMLSVDNFKHFKSFLAEDGSYGVVFYVDPKYTSRLYTASASKISKFMLPVVSGMAFTPQLITEPLRDQLVIWNGLNGYDLRRISEKISPVEPEIEEKRYLEIDPRPRPDFKEIKNQQRDFHGRTIPELPQRN